VGHDPDPLPSVRGANVVSTHHERPSGVACFFQVLQDEVTASSSESTDVFNKNPTGSELSDESCVLEPESAAGAFLYTRTFASDGHVLAGEAAADEVDSSGNRSGCELSYVIVDRHSGPASREDRLAVRFDFAKGHGLESARSVEAKADTADTAEEIQHT
jgi:hypothetical protein